MLEPRTLPFRRPRPSPRRQGRSALGLGQEDCRHSGRLVFSGTLCQGFCSSIALAIFPDALSWLFEIRLSFGIASWGLPRPRLPASCAGRIKEHFGSFPSAPIAVALDRRRHPRGQLRRRAGVGATSEARSRVIAAHRWGVERLRRRRYRRKRTGRKASKRELRAAKLPGAGLGGLACAAALGKESSVWERERSPIDRSVQAGRYLWRLGAACSSWKHTAFLAAVLGPETLRRGPRPRLRGGAAGRELREHRRTPSNAKPLEEARGQQRYLLCAAAL